MSDEYQQVAALLCMDIDLLDDCVDGSTSKEDLLWFIRDLVDKKNDMINDEKSRQNRFSCARLLMGLPVITKVCNDEQ